MQARQFITKDAYICRWPLSYVSLKTLHTWRIKSCNNARSNCDIATASLNQGPTQLQFTEECWENNGHTKSFTYGHFLFKIWMNQHDLELNKSWNMTYWLEGTMTWISPDRPLSTRSWWCLTRAHSIAVLVRPTLSQSQSAPHYQQQFTETVGSCHSHLIQSHSYWIMTLVR